MPGSSHSGTPDTVFLIFVVIRFGEAATPLFAGLYKGKILFDPHRPTIHLSDGGHVRKTCWGKKGQIGPMVRFCVSFQRHR